jgi:hypothetical protein
VIAAFAFGVIVGIASVIVISVVLMGRDIDKNK